MYTNVNGTLTTGGLGEFYLTINYSGNYYVEASIGPVRATCVTLSIPTGETHIVYSQSFETHC